ncbi:MAG: methyl-accepting chemotaxis protein [Halanaerobacter sp.]
MKNEVTLKIGLAIICTLLIISVIIIVDFRQAQFKMVKKEISEIIEKNALKLNKDNQRLKKSVEMITFQQEAGGFGNRKNSINYLKSFLQSNSDLEGVSISYEPNADAQDKKYKNTNKKGISSEGRFLAYWSKEQDDIKLKTRKNLEKNFYAKTKVLQRSIITEPFIYDDQLIISFSAPIVIEDEFVGSAVIDRSLKNIQQSLKKIRSFKTARFYLLSGTNEVIATSHEDELIDQNLIAIPKYKEVFKPLVNSGKLEIVASDELNRFVAHAPVKIGNWKLLMTVDQREILATVNKLTLKVILVSVLGLIGVCSLLYWLISKSLQPLNQLKRRVAEIASKGGDLTQRLEVKSENEIGKLAASFNKLLASLQEIMKEVMSETEEVTEVSRKLSNSSKKGHDIIVETANNIEKMSEEVQDISNNSQRINLISEEASEVAAEGNNNIKKAVSQFKNIKIASENSTTHMEKLDKKIEEINKIIELITNIAEQTNLLALNAAIEAARAGEHGRGFSVVAEEIRDLAEKTATATEEIVFLINQVQQEKQEVLKYTKKNKEEVIKGEEIIEQAGKYFEDIVEGVNHTNKQIQQTSAATQQLDAGTSEVVIATTEIDEIIEEVTISSSNLANNAEKLKSMIDQFEV